MLHDGVARLFRLIPSTIWYNRHIAFVAQLFCPIVILLARLFCTTVSRTRYITYEARLFRFMTPRTRYITRLSRFFLPHGFKNVVYCMRTAAFSTLSDASLVYLF